MTQLDERILEYIDREGWGSPSVMARSRGFSASEGHIREQCLRLYYAGLIEPIAKHSYDLTGDGIRYLNGDLDAEHYPNPRPSAVFQDRYPTPAEWPQARSEEVNWS